MITRGVEWGPVGTWAGAIATVLVVITTALVALGYFDGFRGPRLRLTFEATEPWCRQGKTEGDGTALWVEVGVENLGASPARGCLGRLISVTTNGALRPDIDPVQLRWAGVPPGLRQSAGVSGSRACDAEEGRQDSGGVAGVAAQGGGDVAVTVLPQDADGEVAQAGHGAGRGAGAELVGVLGEGDVADVVQRLDAPVAAHVVGQAGGAGWAAVRLVTACTVTVRQRSWWSGRTLRVIRRAWVAWGKSRPAMVVTCRRRVSTRPWPRSRVWSATGTWCHGRSLSWRCSAGWLALTIRR